MKFASMKTLKRFAATVAVAASLALTATEAGAAYGTVVCSGTVTGLSIIANNVVMVRLSGMNESVSVCNLESNWDVTGIANGYVTGANTCRALYTTLLSAKISGSQLQNVYFDSANAPSSCSTWTSWQTANIRFFVL